MYMYCTTLCNPYFPFVHTTAPPLKGAVCTCTVQKKREEITDLLGKMLSAWSSANYRFCGRGLPHGRQYVTRQGRPALP